MERTMLRRIGYLACLVALTGCAAQRQAQMQAEAKANAQECLATIPKVVGSYVRRAECVNDANTRAGFLSPAQGLLDATRLRLAEQIDRGEISVAQAQQQLAEERYRLDQDIASQRAVASANAAAVLSAMPRPQPYVAPLPYQMPVQRPWSVRIPTKAATYSNLIAATIPA
jgi:hypothetical protein